VPPHDTLHVGGQRHPLLSNGLADHLTPELSEQLAAGLATRIAPRLSIRSVGGAVNDLPADATGYATATRTSPSPRSASAHPRLYGLSPALEVG
jgi:hypothetical protein